MRKWIGLVVWLFALPSVAEVKIAFLEIRDMNGQLVRFERGGRFAHAALAYKGQWLHAVPFYGVVITDTAQLEKVGKIAAVVTLTHRDEPTTEEVARFLGKRFDHDYSWTDDEVYCSELIAKLLGLKPEPMVFDPELWPERYRKLDGLPGLSPDDVYRMVQRP